MAKVLRKKYNVEPPKTEYQPVTISCACGATYETSSFKADIRVDICAACHPFFTGEKRLIDTEGRVDKFRKKYNLSNKTN